MKLNFVFLALIAIFHYIWASEETLEKYHKYSHHKNNAKPKERPPNLDIADAKIYYEGWVKYYHYSNDTHYKKPPSLFQNNAYFAQRIPKAKLKERDRFGVFHIPNKASFFLVVYNQSLSLYSTRKNQVNHLIDSLKIDYIKVIPEDDVLNGGIRDYGNFPFGYCIEIMASIPTHYNGGKITGGMGNPETWVLCTSIGRNKDRLLSTLIKLKVKHQRLQHNGMKITTAEKKLVNKPKPGIGSMIANPLAKKQSLDFGPKTGVGSSLKDGYWVMLQDWTSCSKKCGGGLSYLQRMCVPPKNGGKACVGEPLLKNPCNKHPCPSVNSLLTLIKKSRKSNDPAVAPKPIVKAGVFSNRPQRYSKCKIRENDAFIMTKVVGAKELVKKPIRIVMNNMTISVFNDDHYQELYYSFNLQKTQFTYSHTQCCFMLQDNLKKDEFCGYNEYCGPKDKNVWIDGWSSDFKLFKLNCKTELPVNSNLNEVLIKQDIEDDVKKKSSISDDQVQTTAANEQAILVKKEVLKQAKRQYEKKKKKAEDMSFTVIGKEINLENMVKREEEVKQETEVEKLQTQIKQEEYKQDCLEQSFQERELDDEFVESEKESSDDVDEVEQHARKKIFNSRNKLRRTIQQMKMKTESKTQSLTGKLKQIRMKMSKEIMLANKNGSIDNCRKGKKDADFRETYCNNNFVEDWTRNADCKSDDFCYVCCETEFGAMFVTNRDNCYKMCDFKPKKKEEKPIQKTIVPAALRKELEKSNPTPTTDDGVGRWVWAPKEKSKDPGDNKN